MIDPDRAGDGYVVATATYTLTVRPQVEAMTEGDNNGVTSVEALTMLRFGSGGGRGSGFGLRRCWHHGANRGVWSVRWHQFQAQGMAAGVKELGYVATDGFTAGRSISTSDTTMLRSKVPVRSDVESITHTIKFALGEANNFVNALYHGQAVSTFGANKDAAWLYNDDETSGAYERVRPVVGFVDGNGSRAVYRGDRLPREDHRYRRSVDEAHRRRGLRLHLRRLLRSDIGQSITRGQDGPGLATHLTYLRRRSQDRLAARGFG